MSSRGIPKKENSMEGKKHVDPCACGCGPKIAAFLSKISPFPKKRDFFGYFQRSSEATVASAAILRQMIANENERQTLLRSLDDQEHIGDRITHEVIELLHRTFLTPIDREDIHRLVNKLDDVTDSIHATGNRLSLYRITKMPAGMEKLADTLVRSTEELSRTVSALRNLGDVKAIQAGCIAIADLENQADEIFNGVLKEIFHTDYPPQQIIQVKELLENLERTTDRCKDVAVIVQGIVLKHS